MIVFCRKRNSRKFAISWPDVTGVLIYFFRTDPSPTLPKTNCLVFGQIERKDCFTKKMNNSAAMRGTIAANI